MILPDKITAGTSFGELVTLTAYPAPEWVLVVLLRGAGVIDITATAEGTQHRLAADAATTGQWAPGEYWLSARVSRGADVVEVETGRVIIAPDLLQAGAGHDGRSHARKVLDAINAVIERRATMDQERYTIKERELWRTPLPDLLRLRSEYMALVRAEERKARGRPLIEQWRVRI